MSLQKELKTGMIWSAIERFSGQGISFALSIIIARILMPSDYGLIAMMSIFIGLSQNLVDSGFVDALVQKKNKTEQDYNTTFFFNIALGIFIYLILFLVAPLIADFYNEPQLELLVRVFGILPFVTSLGLVLRAQMFIEFKFKALAITGLLSVIVSGGVGVWMAYNGYGVWALVLQTILNALCNALFMWLEMRWIPRFQISLASFKSLWCFGSKILFTAMINTMYVNMYTLLIGKRYSTTDTGLFNRAHTLAMFPALNLTTVLLKVFYPLECKMQDDNEALRRVFMISIRLSCFVIFPLMLGLASLAKPFIILLLGEQWIDSVPLLRILSVAFMWNAMMLLNSSIINVKGRTDYTLKAEIIKKFLGVIMILLLLPWGLYAICSGWIIYAFIDVIVITHYVKKVLDITLWSELKQIVHSLILSVVMAVGVYFLTLNIEEPYCQLLVGVVAGVVFYVSAACLFKFKEVALILTALKRK